MAVLSPVHWQTITPQMRQVLGFIGQCTFSSRFYLAGGTALALRLGHRRSVDLDFFSAVDEVGRPSRQEIVKALVPLDVQVLEKDFYDLYAIARHVPIPDLLLQGALKYPYARDFELMVLESLVLFDNADRDVQPDLLLDVPWEEVRAFFVALGRRLGEDWFED